MKDGDKMKDFIFIIGPSAVGKTTLAKELYKHYNGVYFEQNMVPEFSIPENCEDEGKFEEQVCWENVLLQLNFFYEKGFKNIVALDFNDLRTREIPVIFKGYNFITLKLISSNPEQIKQQMIHRHNNEGGLYDIDNIIYSNEKIKNRDLLPNEIVIDVSGKSKEEVLNEAINIIDNYKSLLDYEYVEPAKELFNSWVLSDGLRK